MPRAIHRAGATKGRVGQRGSAQRPGDVHPGGDARRFLRRQLRQGQRGLGARLARTDQDDPAARKVHGAHRGDDRRRIVLDRVALPRCHQLGGDAQPAKKLALGGEIGSRLRMTSIEPGRREEHRVGECPRALQSRRGKLDSLPEKAVERRLHAPALRVREQRLRERERGEIHRDFLAQPPELHLIGEPARVRVLQVIGAVRGRRRQGGESRIEVVARQEIGEQPSGGFRVDEGGELRFRPAGRGQIDRAGAPQCQYDRRQHDQPDQAQRRSPPDALKRLDGGRARAALERRSRSINPHAGPDDPAGRHCSAAWADLRKTRGQAPAPSDEQGYDISSL